MTKGDFIEKIMWSLMLHYNSFVIPVFDTYIDKDGNQQRTYKALYPVQPATVEFLDSDNDVYIKMRFPNGEETTLPYSFEIPLLCQ